MNAGLVLVGGGGHCRSVLDLLAPSDEQPELGILDAAAPKGTTVFGYPVIGTDEDIHNLVARGNRFLVTVGHTGDPAPRIRIFDRLKALDARLATLISPSAHVSTRASIGPGTAVMHGAVVNAGASVGANVILNSQSLVEHDARIGDHAHVSTGALVNGGCVVGAACFLGSGSVLSHGVTLAPGIVVGAGTVVIRSLSEPGTYVGNPARRIR